MIIVSFASEVISLQSSFSILTSCSWKIWSLVIFSLQCFSKPVLSQTSLTFHDAQSILYCPFHCWFPFYKFKFYWHTGKFYWLLQLFLYVTILSLKMFLTSPWSFGNKALIDMTTINCILATIASDSNKRNFISCFLAFFNILWHLMWKSSITVPIAGIFLMRSSKWVTSFERI